MPSAPWPARLCSSNPSRACFASDGIEQRDLADLLLQSDPRRGRPGRRAVRRRDRGAARTATAEDRLRESEERFRLIADSAPVPMWVTKLDRKRGFVNRAYVDFVGVCYEEAVDFDWRSIIHPDDAERVLAESIAGEASLKPFVLEARFRRGDGEYRWLRSISQPRWGAGGRACRLHRRRPRHHRMEAGRGGDARRQRDCWRPASRPAPPTCAPRSTGCRPRSASASGPKRRSARRRRWRRWASSPAASRTISTIC